MKFGQLIEYNRNNFVEKPTRNVAEKLFTGPFLEKEKLSLSLDQ